jgi:hypothetical protein
MASAAFFLCATSAQAGSHLVATLRDSTPPGTHDRVLVTLVLTNDGDQPVHVFEPATPFIAAGGRLARDQFEAVNALGHKAPYRGRWVNWGGTVMAVFRLIQPGEVLEATVDLTDEYDFGTGGPFTLRYVLSMDWTPDPERNTAAELATFTPGGQRVVQSNSVTVMAPAYREPVGRVASVIADRCSEEQQSVADRAWMKAKVVANNAQVFTRSLAIKTTHPRYAKWFGDSSLLHAADDVDTPRKAYIDHVKDIVGATYSRLAFGTLSTQCGCEGFPDATAAHIEDRMYYRVYLCPAFFRQLEDGPSPSRVGTLIHEYGHFVGDGRGPSSADYLYGRVGAQRIAVDDPRTAIRNADNYEYYITDTTPYEEP